MSTNAHAHGATIDVILKSRNNSSAMSRAQVDERNGGTISNATSQAAAWDPDTDPAFQKALRDRLMSNEDSIFFSARLMDTAKNKTVYGLQDPCTDQRGAALTRCRTTQECTDDTGAAGVNMDIVIGGANDRTRAARGTQMCVSNTQADQANDEGYVPLPVFTLQDFQQLAVAPAASHVQPAPDTLKNMHTNVYAQAEPQTFTTTLGGYPVQVRAYPVQYTWDYGDGTTLGPTPLTGAPLPDGAWDEPTDTSHVYTTTGDYTVRLTTSFYGEYNIADTGWQPVAGYNQVTSPPVALSVWRATVHNVADDCHTNPTGIGCPGTDK
ncbi:hypothetical protein [Kocuria sp.]|uniref:PKD domain-containing protein n=1 Tax=Kocuria sp. TaxID=1871328 RepID=UPI0025C40344|nr:hypothetical protein [Kocuria sp.]